MENEVQQEIRSYDVVVIGGGVGGYTAAVRAANAGLKTALIERIQLGGAGVNQGCIPIQYLYKNVQFIKECAQAKKRGLIIKGIELDLPRMMRDKNQKIRKYIAGMKERLEDRGVDIFMGTARVNADKTVEIAMGNGIEGRIKAESIILATGSTGRIPKQYQSMPEVLTDENAHDLVEIPPELVIIGSGGRACEYATLFSMLGSKVVLFVGEDHLLSSEVDGAIQEAVEQNLLAMQVDIHYNVTVSDVFEDSLGDIHLDVKLGSRDKMIICSDILVVKERCPNLLGLSGLDLKVKNDGVIADFSGITSVPGVYAIGDLVSGMASASAAVAMAIQVVDTITGKQRTLKNQWIPKAIHLLPEIAVVGMSEAEARQNGYPVKVDRIDLATNLKLYLDDATTGFVKIISDVDSGELLGVCIYGEGAAELISQAQAIHAMGGGIEDLKRSLHAYPAASAVLSEATLAFLK